MKKIKKSILKMNMASRIVCCVLSLALVVGAVAFGINSFSATGGQSVESLDSKTYLSDIVDRIAEGKQKYFTILEIVPYQGMGEFKYFAGAKEVEKGILNRSNADLTKFYNMQSGAYGSKNVFIKIQSYFSNFGYHIKYNSYQKKYEIKCDEVFNNMVLGDPYRSLLEGKIRVNTVEANDLTSKDINSADLIIITDTCEDDETLKAYNYYTGQVQSDGVTPKDTTGVYKKVGDNYVECKISDARNITFETYEQKDGKFVSRDLSWKSAKALLDYIEIGRDLRGDGKLTKTPVIFSATLTEGSLDKTSNMYKVCMLYRMLGDGQYEDFINNHMSTVDADGKKFKTSTGVYTAAFCYETEIQQKTTQAPTTQAPTTTQAETTTEAIETSEGETTSEGEETSGADDETTNPIETTTADDEDFTPPAPLIGMKFINGFTSQDIVDSKVLDNSGLIDDNPNANKRLTNDYWVHNHDAKLIVSNLDHKLHQYSKIYVGLEERCGANATVVDVIRYLLGCKDTYVPKYDFGKVRILEVEPCNSFRYNTYEKVLELAKKMSINTSKWTSSNYKKYMEVRCVTTRELNSITTDLISTYDAIIIGDKYDRLTTVEATDASGNKYQKPIYNDRHLDGYVYLAYGDLVKASTTLMGYVPSDYAKYNGTYGASDKFGGVKVNGSNSYIVKVTEYPEDVRYSSYNWSGTNFANSDENKELAHQVRYNQIFTLSSTTKNVWTDYQYDTLSSLYSQGDLLGVIRVDTYFKNKAYSNMVDMFNDRIGNARLSDNDITAKTMDSLKAFADSGKLMVFADMVYDNDGSKIFPTSHLASFMNYINYECDDANYLRESNLAGFITHINAMSPKLTFAVTPPGITYDGNDIINLPSNYNRTLSYAFAIDGYENTTYVVRLIIDKDGNGVFQNSQKIVTDDTNEVYKVLQVTTDKNGHADVSFSTELAPDMNGLIAYKIEVTMMKDGMETDLRSSYIQYTAVRAMDIKTVKVLQLIPYSQYKSSNSSLALNMRYQLDANNNIAAANQSFGTLLKAIDGERTGYKLQIDTMYTYEFEAKFSKDDPYIMGESWETGVDYLNSNEYDMVVIGFGDIYRGDDISNLHGAIDNIKDFIAHRRAVMFAHDTMSFNSFYNYVTVDNATVSGNTATGTRIESIPKTSNRMKSLTNLAHIDNDKMCTNITINLRNVVGMDRYGITESVTNRNGKDKPTYSDESKMNYSTASSDGNYYVEELQGYSDWVLLRQGLVSNYSTTNNQNGFYLVKPFRDDAGLLTQGTGCWWTTTKIEKVNEGQVTMFPYKINDSISVAQTHPQYYQLDMEDDDLVVWYTLQSASSNDYFDIAKKDGQNNYYIYSKGSVTYTGAGHTTIGSSAAELKLFINTIIKAIDSANNTPVVKFDNGAEASGYYNIYTSVGGPYKLKFTATDADLMTYEGANGDMNKVGRFEKGRIVWDKNSNGIIDASDVVLQSYTRKGLTGTSILYNGISVTIDLSTCEAMKTHQAELENQVVGAGADFIVEAYDLYGARGTAKAKITTRELFELD